LTQNVLAGRSRQAGSVIRGTPGRGVTGIDRMPLAFSVSADGFLASLGFFVCVIER